jgi:sugar transferase (PEP-CTERM/EpsH1 system associated)
MRIAVFTPYLPYPPDTGGKIRSYNLVIALSASFEVDLYTVCGGAEPPQRNVEALQGQCRRVAVFPLRRHWRTRARIQRMLSPVPRLVQAFSSPHSLAEAEACLNHSAYDLVIADEICMAPYAELRPDLPRIVTRQKIDSAHHREIALARPLGLEKIVDLLEAVKLRWYERAKMPAFQGCLVCSEQDAQHVGRDAPDVPTVVVPNGADLSHFAPSGRPRATEPTLLYVGSMHYYPNIDAVQFLFDEMYPQIQSAVPDVKVQIVGHAPPPEIRRLGERDGVGVTGSVPDVRPYYERSTVFVVPLRMGGGTRLKIVEAMAMGLPVVSTTVGAEGLEIRPGENILIADSPSAFVDSVLRLLSDPGLWGRIAEGGRRLARRYDWMEITKPWVQLVEAVAKQWR